MLISKISILFQEVPGEVSLGISIQGCNKKCKGCHSPELWSLEGRNFLSEDFELELKRYKGLITNVIFFGGDYFYDEIFEFLKIAAEHNVKTTLYSGYEINDLPTDLVKELTYLKVGAYVEELGGLDSKTTNQRLYKVDGWEDITSIFWRENC
jgi:anaerobic ribonucleoside-triphosphate reductase activating protein